MAPKKGERNNTTDAMLYVAKIKTSVNCENTAPNELLEYMTQASIFSPPQLASSLLDSVAEARRVQA